MMMMMMMMMMMKLLMINHDGGCHGHNVIIYDSVDEHDR
jgi:hypothetical protein